MLNRVNTVLHVVTHEGLTRARNMQITDNKRPSFLWPKSVRRNTVMLMEDGGVSSRKTTAAKKQSLGEYSSLIFECTLTTDGWTGWRENDEKEDEGTRSQPDRSPL